MPAPSDISPPDLMLKIIWMGHFILSTWAKLSLYMPEPYFYSHLAFLAFAFWAIVNKESSEAILMSFVTLAFSVVNDILVISIYEPRTHDQFENSTSGLRNEHRFAVAMSIINLVIKPVSLFLLYRIYQTRTTGETFLNTSNISDNFSGLGSHSRGQNQGSYSNIDSQNHQQGGAYGSNPNAPGYPPGYQSAPVYQYLPPSGENSPQQHPQPNEPSPTPGSGAGQQPKI